MYVKLMLTHETFIIYVRVYTSESTAREKGLFVAERHKWYDLCADLSQRCSCALTVSTQIIDKDSVMQACIKSSIMYITLFIRIQL